MLRDTTQTFIALTGGVFVLYRLVLFFLVDEKMDCIRRMVFKLLKMRGLSITSDATDALVSVLSR